MNLHFNTDFCVDIPFSNPTVAPRSLDASPCHSPGRHLSAHRCLFNVFVFSGGAGSAAGHGAAFGGGSWVQIRGLCPQRRAGPAHHESPGNMQQAYLHVPVHVGCVSPWLLRCHSVQHVCLLWCVQDYSWEDHGFSLVNRLLPDMGQFLDEKFQVHTPPLTQWTG